MCCFSRNAIVADTNIFARDGRDGRQFLAYSMRFSSKEDLAMILPIPTPRNAAEDAVRFINLEKYADFFKDLRAGFPLPNGGSRSKNTFGAAPANSHTLKVVEVGSFEASFVPAVKDFGRLDERFRLPADTWDRLPAYKEFGFAVFKLKKGSEQKVHPLAFEFPRARPRQLFFPTVHIHDGQVHARAKFDHALYCQADRMLMGWVESRQPAEMFMKVNQAAGLLDGRQHCYMKEIRGVQKNEDILV
jgi:hypothetical protein